MPTPTISIVTIAYNSAKTIADTIASVRAQQYPGLEYIVIDGGSTDGTLAILEANHDLITSWVSEPDKGIYDAMNKGVARATGEIVGIVNSDDFLEPGALAAVAEAAAAHPEADLFVGNIRVLLDDQGREAFESKPRQDVMGDRFKSIPVPHPATFVRRRVYEELGGFDTRYRVSADYEFILRCLKADKQFVFLDRILSNFRAGGASGTAFMRTTREERDIKLAYGCPPGAAWRIFWRSSISYYLVGKLNRVPGFKRAYKALKSP